MYNLIISVNIRRSFLLVCAVIVVIILGINSFNRIMTLRGTSQKVASEEARLEQLKKDNERLKAELSYKKSNDFAEKEIRDKLGLSKEGEEVILVPKETEYQNIEEVSGDNSENWKKWREIFLGS